MKRKLFLYLSLSAIAAGCMTSCQEEDLGFTKDEISYAATIRDYTNNFVELYGPIAEGHTWGFDTPALTRATDPDHGYYKVNRGRIANDDVLGFETMKGSNLTTNNFPFYKSSLPDPVTLDEAQYVCQYIYNHPEEGYTTDLYTTYFIQTVAKVKHNYISKDGVPAVGCEKMDYLWVDQEHNNDYNGTVCGWIFEPTIDLSSPAHYVASSANKVSEVWDSQLFINLDQALSSGDTFEFSMKVRADKNATISSQFHKTAGDYLFYQAVGQVNFTTSWTTYNNSGTIPNDAVGAQCIAFQLNDLAEANIYYIADVSFKVNGVEFFQSVSSKYDNGAIEPVTESPAHNGGGCTAMTSTGSYQPLESLVVRSATTSPSFKESFSSGGEITNHYKYYQIEYNGKIGTYLAFDFAAAEPNHPTDADGHYDDWVVKITDAHRATNRVFCEDLGSIHDWDFNDLVFDYTIESGYIYIDILAESGTLPLGATFDSNIIGVHTPVGAAPGHAYLPKEAPILKSYKFASTVTNIQNLNFWALHNSTTTWTGGQDNHNANVNGRWEIRNQTGCAPFMIQVPTTVDWPNEGVNIGTKYGNFKSWVNSNGNAHQGEWWN